MNPIVIAPATVAPITVRPADGVPVKVTPVAVPAIQIGGVPGIPGSSGISVLEVEATQDADGKVTLRFAMSNGAVHEVKFRAGGALPPGNLDLAGSTIGMALAEATLRADRMLAGASTATGTASASLAAWLDLAAAANASGAANGRLSAVLDLAASAQAVAAGEGVLALTMELAGAVTTRAEAAGMLRLGADLALQATAVCRATATSVMLLDVVFASTAAGRGLASATLLAALDGAGSATGRGTASGSIFVARSLAASVSGVALASGTIELAAAAGYDADAQAYFNAMTVQPSDTRKGQIDTLVKGLKADGIWTKLDWLCLLAAHDAQAGRLNARNPAKALAALNAPSFTMDRGFKGDGSTSHLSFGEAFNASGNVYALESALLGAWCSLQGASTTTRPLIGSSQSTRSYIRPTPTGGSGTAEARMNSGVSINLGGSDTLLGGRILTRIGSDARYYRNGEFRLELNSSGGAVATGPAYALRNGSDYSDDRLSAVSTGSGLTASEVQALHNRITTYLNAIGAA